MRAALRSSHRPSEVDDIKCVRKRCLCRRERTDTDGLLTCSWCESAARAAESGSCQAQAAIAERDERAIDLELLGRQGRLALLEIYCQGAHTHNQMSTNEERIKRCVHTRNDLPHEAREPRLARGFLLSVSIRPREMSLSRVARATAAS